MTISDTEVDRILRELGGYNRWQLLNYFSLQTVIIYCYALNTLVVVFSGASIPHHCQIPTNASVNDSIPWDNDTNSLSSCLMYDNHSEVECRDGWSYGDISDLSLVTEWNLVCDQSYLVDLSQSIYQVGIMMGSIIFSNLADFFGRKPVLIFCHVAVAILGVGVSAVQTMTSYVVLRSILAIFVQGTFSGYTMSLELFSAEYRTFAGVVVEYVWCGGMFLLLLLAYFVRNWRHLQLIIALPNLLTIGFIWLLPESIPWLLVNGRMEQAKKVLKHAAKVNKVPVPVIREDEELVPMKTNNEVNENSAVDSLVSKDHKPAKKAEKGHFGVRTVQRFFRHVNATRKMKEGSETVLNLFKSRRMLLISLVMGYIWFVNALVYWGLVFSVATLFPGDVYVNFSLTVVAECAAYIVMHFILRHGRKKPLCAFHVIAGVFLIGAVFVPSQSADGTDLTPLAVTFGIICKFGISASFGVIFLFTPELFPTNIRSTGMGLCWCCGIVGTIVAPFSSTVARHYAWLPGTLFGVLSIVAAGLSLLLPETLGRPLPETVRDVENWNSKGDKVALRDTKQTSVTI